MGFGDRQSRVRVRLSRVPLGGQLHVSLLEPPRAVEAAPCPGTGGCVYGASPRCMLGASCRRASLSPPPALGFREFSGWMLTLFAVGFTCLGPRAACSRCFALAPVVSGGWRSAGSAGPARSPLLTRAQLTGWPCLTWLVVRRCVPCPVSAPAGERAPFKGLATCSLHRADGCVRSGLSGVESWPPSAPPRRRGMVAFQIPFPTSGGNGSTPGAWGTLGTLTWVGEREWGIFGCRSVRGGDPRTQLPRGSALVTNVTDKDLPLQGLPPVCRMETQCRGPDRASSCWGSIREGPGL